MNIVYSRLLILNLLTPCLGSPFLNLDFQSPNIKAISNPQSGGVVRVHDALPGWQLQIGNEFRQLMYYNNVCITCPSASLGGPENPVNGDAFGFTIKSGYYSPNFTMLATSIYQTGDVPIKAQSLQFVAGVDPNFESLHVSVGGQQLRFIQLEKNAFYEYRYAADVSKWAGEAAELRFTIGPGAFDEGAAASLAGIHFSPDPLPATPEPSTWALLCTGLAALIWNAPCCRSRPTT